MRCFTHIIGSGSLSSPIMFVFHVPFHLLTFEERTTGCGKSFERDGGPALTVRRDLFEEYTLSETHFQGQLWVCKANSLTWIVVYLSWGCPTSRFSWLSFWVLQLSSSWVFFLV